MADKAWKEFFTDNMTRQALNESEVFREYSKAELKREAEGELNKANECLDNEVKTFDNLDAFRDKVANNPQLKEIFKRAKIALESNPELADKVDPNFIEGLNLLDLE